MFDVWFYAFIAAVVGGALALWGWAQKRGSPRVDAARRSRSLRDGDEGMTVPPAPTDVLLNQVAVPKRPPIEPSISRLDPPEGAGVGGPTQKPRLNMAVEILNVEPVEWPDD